MSTIKPLTQSVERREVLPFDGLFKPFFIKRINQRILAHIHRMCVEDSLILIRKMSSQELIILKIEVTK